jgi:menaquinone-dependent protoporphyrinogen IX oxidase
LVKVFVLYDSKYGNTKLAAEKILEGMMESSGIETEIACVKEIDPGKLADYDVLVLGAPNHMGRPSQTMKKFIDSLAEQNLKAKNVAVFGTYAGKEREDRAVKQLENMAAKKLHSQILISPGLSVRVNGIPGPIVEGELPKCVEFGKQITAQIKNQTA